VVPVSCYVSGNSHFFTTSPSDVPSGYTLDPGLTFYAFAQPVPGTIAVYQYRNSTNTAFQYSTNGKAISGWVCQGVAWYVSPTTNPLSGAVPILHYENASTGDNFYTTSTSTLPGYTYVDDIGCGYSAISTSISISVPDTIFLC